MPSAKNESTLHTKTLALAQKFDGTQFELAEQSSVPYFWLRGFLNGTIKRPGVDRVQKLYEFLSGKKLAL